MLADTPGWCIYAFCNASCQIDFLYGECFLTTATTSNLSVISSSPCKGNVQKCEKQPPPYSAVVPAFSRARDCNELVPPRKVSKQLLTELAEWKMYGITVFGHGETYNKEIVSAGDQNKMRKQWVGSSEQFVQINEVPTFKWGRTYFYQSAFLLKG